MEDDDSFRKQIIREIYKSELDVDITEVESASNALHAIEYLNFDVCLIDVEFQNINKFGIDLSRRLKLRDPDQQIIMMSEYSDASIRDRVHDELDIAYFYKKDYCQDKQDYDFTRLIGKLRHALQTAKKLNKRKLKMRKNRYSHTFDIDDVWYVEKKY